MTDWNRELIMAAREGNPFRLISALDHGAELEHKDEIGWTAFLWAGFGGRLEVIRILNERAKCNKLVTNEHGETALHLAAMYGRLNVTKYLVEQAGISVMIRTKEGETPYSQAAEPRLWPQDENMRSVANYLQAIIRDRNKKLISAARDGNFKDVKTWLGNGADIDYQDSDGKTALHQAAQSGHLPITKYLVAHGLSSPLVKTHEGETPYDLAAAMKQGQYKEVMEYLQADMSVKKTTVEGCIFLPDFKVVLPFSTSEIISKVFYTYEVKREINIVLNIADLRFSLYENSTV